MLKIIQETGYEAPKEAMPYIDYVCDGYWPKYKKVKKVKKIKPVCKPIPDWVIARNEELPVVAPDDEHSEIFEVDSALVSAIAEAVKLELKPWFDRLYENEACGTLRGAKEINAYMGISTRFHHMDTLRRWFLKYGFPLVKDMKGKWYTTKNLIDKWIFENSIIMKKSIELGFLAPRNYRNRLYFAPQMLTAEERDECVREITKDRARLGMSV